MRSATYSLFTTLLLLVPICAVPLMAIFGVPQFTPVVSSPLDDDEEDEWERPPRKRSSRPRTSETAEEDLEISADETWNWDDAPPKRPPPGKKPRPIAHAVADEEAAEVPKSLFTKNRNGKSASASFPGKKPGPLPIPDDDLTEGTSIRQAGFDEADEERPFVTTANETDEVEEALSNAKTAPKTIPGYRRPRTGSAEDATDKNAPRAKRNANTAEPLTWKKAVDRLNELGIRNFRLEPGVKPGEFTFTCSYTPSQTPHVTRKFEAEADDPLKAVGQVLLQVERWAQLRDADAPKRSADPRDNRLE